MKFITANHYKPNGVPVLSAAEIDYHAERIAEEIQPEHFCGQVDATDLQLLLGYLDGWHYSGRYLSKSGTLLGLASFSGGELIVTDEGRRVQAVMEVPPNTIMVDRALYYPEFEPIFRFTFAHECGHALLHRRFCRDPENMKAYSEQGRERFLPDTEKSLEVHDEHRLKNDYDWLEWQANTFASAVLMPGKLVLQAAELVKKTCTSEMQYMNQLNAAIADVFKVSMTAAFYRMKALGIADDDWIRLKSGMIVHTE